MNRNDELGVQVGEQTFPSRDTNLNRIDNTKLMQVWELNIKTQRSVLQQLELNRKVMRLTQFITIGALVIVALVGYTVGAKLDETIDIAKRIEANALARGLKTDELFTAQSKQTDRVLEAMVRLLEAQQLEARAEAKPKDQERKREAQKARAEALVTTLKAKKETVTTVPASVDAENKIIQIQEEAKANGLDIDVPSY